MIILKATTETLELTTSSAADIDYSVSYADITTTTFSPSTNEGKIVSVTTTPICVAPGASTQRQIKMITITNRHASTSNTILVKKDISGTEYYLTPVVILLAGETVQYIEGTGWVHYLANGSIQGSYAGAAGADTLVQFNDGGSALGADADFTWTKASSKLTVGGTSNNGTLALGGGTTDASIPPSGQIYFYSKNIGGKMMPKWIGPAGIDNPVQPGIGFNGIKQVAPATGTTAATCMTAFATAFTNTATTLTQVAVASGSIKGIMRSVTLATSTTANALASHFTPQYEVCGYGGYLFVSRFYVSGTLRSGQIGFHGLANRTAIFTYALSNATTETTVAKVGLGYALSGTTGNWMVCAASGSAVMPPVDLGATYFAVNVTDVIELVLFCAPNTSSIGYRVTNLTQGSASVATGTINTNIPAVATSLGVHHYVTNATTAAASTFGLNKWYLESDY